MKNIKDNYDTNDQYRSFNLTQAQLIIFAKI